MAHIYFDHHATTPLLPEINSAMAPYFNEKFGNSMSLHSWGQEAQSGLQKARQQVASLFNANPEQVIFTSGSTESIHTAVLGWLLAQVKISECLVITSTIEHKATYGALKLATQLGAETAQIAVDQYGLLKTDDLMKKIVANKDRPVLFTLIHGHNEIGTVQDISDIAQKISKYSNVAFHVDAAQSAGKITIDFKNTSLHMLSLSGHKLYGPKGIGALLVKESNTIRPLFQGGGQEFGLRAGTVNIPAAVGLGFACEWAQKNGNMECERLTQLRELFFKLVTDHPAIQINGHRTQRLPNNINITLPRGDADSIAFALHDVAYSAGSACNSQKKEPNPILAAIGLTPAQSESTLRLGLGLGTTEEEVRHVAKKIIAFINK